MCGIWQRKWCRTCLFLAAPCRGTWPLHADALEDRSGRTDFGGLFGNSQYSGGLTLAGDDVAVGKVAPAVRFDGAIDFDCTAFDELARLPARFR